MQGGSYHQNLVTLRTVSVNYSLYVTPAWIQWLLLLVHRHSQLYCSTIMTITSKWKTKIMSFQDQDQHWKQRLKMSHDQDASLENSKPDIILELITLLGICWKQLKMFLSKIGKRQNLIWINRSRTLKLLRNSQKPKSKTKLTISKNTDCRFDKCNSSISEVHVPAH